VGNGKPGEKMNENLAAVDEGGSVSKRACSKAGKSSVTLKDRAELNTRHSRQGMGNGVPGEKMDENLAAVDMEDPALECAWIYMGKTLVTLKDRSELNARLSKQGSE
jgi:hypothetical protein